MTKVSYGHLTNEFRRYHIKHGRCIFIMDGRGITVSYMGGMGNQMFIVAAGYAAHRATGLPLFLPIPVLEDNKHNMKRYNYLESIFKYFGTHLPFIINSPHFRAFHAQFGYKEHELSIYKGFEPWDPTNVKPATHMASYYQYYPAISPYENEIRALFSNGLVEYRAKFSIESSAAFLHIRRGDFLESSHVFYIQPLSYYMEAVNVLLQKNTNVKKIYILSDDIQWVKEQSMFRIDLFEIYEGDDELDALALMSLCTEGAICANSTFSWWGAFLGAYGTRRPVIIPNKWMAANIVDLFPSEWIRI